MNDLFHAEPKELISDSLRDQLPNEEDKEKTRDGVISVMVTSNFTEIPTIGFLIGVEMLPGDTPVFKLDLKMMLFEAFDFIAGFCSRSTSSTIYTVILNYEEKIVKLDGPYGISSTKIIDVDSASSSCILAMDLVRMDVEKK